MIEPFEQSKIVCRDLCKFVYLVLQKRSLENSESLLVKVEIEGRGGFRKTHLSVFDMDILISGSKVGLFKKFKDSRVKKVFLIANDQNVRNCGCILGCEILIEDLQ